MRQQLAQRCVRVALGVVSGRSKYLQVSKPTYNAGVACARSRRFAVLVPYKTLVNSSKQALGRGGASTPSRHPPRVIRSGTFL